MNHKADIAKEEQGDEGFKPLLLGTRVRLADSRQLVENAQPHLLDVSEVEDESLEYQEEKEGDDQNLRLGVHGERSIRGFRGKRQGGPRWTRAVFSEEGRESQNTARVACF